MYLHQLLIVTSLLTLSSNLFAKNIKHGKYLVQIMGCNDCHTPMYGPKEGNVPESEWLIGSEVGFKGPWGTTYPSNLRQIVQDMSEKDWVNYLQHFKARPPMPSYDTKKLSKNDMVAVYHFIKSLGPSQKVVPSYLAPDIEPKTPFIDFTVKINK